MTPKAMRPMTFFLYYDVFLPKNLFLNLEPPLCTGRFTPLAPLCIVKLVIWNFFPDHSRHLGGVLGPSPSPWRTPTSARPGTDLRAYFIEQLLMGRGKLVTWNFFLTSPDIWVGSLGHPIKNALNIQKFWLCLFRQIGLNSTLWLVSWYKNHGMYN